MNSEVIIAALCHVNPLPVNNIKNLQSVLLPTGKKESVLETLLLAAEDINGTISGPESGITRLLAAIENPLEIESLP